MGAYCADSVCICCMGKKQIHNRKLAAFHSFAEGSSSCLIERKPKKDYKLSADWGLDTTQNLKQEQSCTSLAMTFQPNNTRLQFLPLPGVWNQSTRHQRICLPSGVASLSCFPSFQVHIRQVTVNCVVISNRQIVSIDLLFSPTLQGYIYICTTNGRTERAMKKRHVTLFVLSTDAPPSNSTLAVTTNPFSAARCKGVSPSWTSN